MIEFDAAVGIFTRNGRVSETFQARMSRFRFPVTCNECNRKQHAYTQGVYMSPRVFSFAKPPRGESVKTVTCYRRTRKAACGAGFRAVTPGYWRLRKLLKRGGGYVRRATCAPQNNTPIYREYMCFWNPATHARRNRLYWRLCVFSRTFAQNAANPLVERLSGVLPRSHGIAQAARLSVIL